MSKTLRKSRSFARRFVSVSAKPRREVCLISIIAMLSISFVFSSCSASDLTTESENEFDEVLTSASENNLIPEISAEQFIKENILPNYQDIGKGVYLEWEIEYNDVVFDCNNFQNTIIGWIVGDLNNDNSNDILTISLEKHNKEFDKNGEKNTVFVHRTPYIYENGNFLKKTAWSKKLFEGYLSISNHISMDYRYAMVSETGNNYLAESVTIENDSAVYSEEYPPYYSAENSLGDYETDMSLIKYEDENFSTLFGYHERISHVSCMPEAEQISYYDTKNGESLFFSGVTGVTTGSDMPAPEFKYETSGKYESEEQAIGCINQSLSEYGMKKYQLLPYSWVDRYDNSLVLDEPKNKSCSFKLTGETISKTKRKCFVELI